jgi:hypothetical protein
MVAPHPVTSLLTPHTSLLTGPAMHAILPFFWNSREVSQFAPHVVVSSRSCATIQVIEGIYSTYRPEG